ncbi:rhamnulose-1-phosphate aldolase [Faecalicatena acetigenes]|uniref:Rhamnulose-1-phosphate aldolase n=1 Tax=Faecalicatena acetigenes TaxID=2981790 RepID=A0ABT2TEU2_9FIRM|nr:MULTISPECIES: rhamnulose-1-phosphate aldolase [Lachnospiraceae]MCU6748332.1 rhamnulose-1-phosphate aldolase [Faecalicatena acetigenes]SCI38345.1 Rhamnulose-1-phosphate aldolase [uncultured Clostridium sp.]
MKILECKFLQDFVKMAEDGYQQGWHERNGGNLSYRLKKGEVDAIRQRLSDNASWQSIGTSVPGLAGEHFLVTGSGKYFRNIVVDPEACLAIIEIDESGNQYRIRWGLAEGGKPTSELPTHLMNHEIKKRLTGGKHRVIYHAHTTNTIALTFVLPLNDEVFTRELWEMATECPVVFPEGVGVVGWMVPGGRDIAVATSKLMEKYNAVIWAHHGMFCSGEDFDLTFGLMHTIEKSAEILIKVMSMVPQKRQTIEPEDFRDLAKGFNVELSERFLYDKRSLSI